MYFINYAFDRLVPFFEKSLAIECCYEQQAIILWLAWHRTKDPRAKSMLDKMCNTSEKARLALIKFLDQSDCLICEEAVYYLLMFMSQEYSSQELASAYDSIFFRNRKELANMAFVSIAEAFVVSPLIGFKLSGFYQFLASYALENPMQTLSWLQKALEARLPEEYYDWSIIIDVLIQSYNGVKSFGIEANQAVLENAMDLLDNLIQKPATSHLFNVFVSKLDYE